MEIRKYILLVALLTDMASVQATDRLKVDDVVLAIGNKSTLTIEADFEKDNFIGYQLDITLPKGLSLSLDAGNRPAAVSFTDLDITGSIHATTATSTTYRFVASKMGNPRLPAGSYTLLTATIEDDGSLSVDDVEACTITSIKFSDANQQGTNFDDVMFNVTVTNEIILDENSTIVPDPATGTNVRVKRTIQANQWSTICLPFAMTEAQVKAAFGDDVQLGDFAGYETAADDDENIVGIKVNFEDATAIEANHPYIIKVTDNISEFTADNVDIAPEDEPTVAAVRRTKKQWSEMIGSYVPTTIDNQMLFLSGNQFWYSVGATKMKGYRAYFDFYDVLTEVEGAYGSRIALHFANGETSSLSVIKSGSKLQECVYNLNGQRVFQPAKGLYIVDGKKVIIN